MNLNVMLFCVFLWLVLLELAGKRLQKQIKSFFFFFFCILIKSEAFNQTNRRMRKKLLPSRARAKAKPVYTYLDRLNE